MTKQSKPSEKTLSRTAVHEDRAGLHDDDKTQLSRSDQDKTLLVSSQTGDDKTQLSSPIDDDKTQLSSLSEIDDDKTQLSSEANKDSPSALLVDDAETQLSAPSIPTGATKTLVRKYQRTSSGDLEIGSVIRDRFIIEKLLGSGGMGSVYRALDIRKKEAKDEQPYIALKVLRGNFQYHKSAFIALQREAKKTQALAHPNIVTVYDFDRDDELIFITMEELNGDALNDIIRGRTARVLSEKDKISIVEQIAKGLSHAHSKGLVHSDFARAANQDSYQDNFDAGSIGALTAAYASLEMWQFKDPHPSDDIYALGVIACELLHGAHPYGRESAQDVFDKKLRQSKLNIKNPFVRGIVHRSVALERKNRIDDGEAFLNKFNNARKLPLRLTFASFLLAAGIAANAMYINTIERVEHVDFSSLPVEQQQQFIDQIAEGNMALSVGDIQGSVALLNSAYDIHQTHDDIAVLREAILRRFEQSYSNSGDAQQSAFYREQLEVLKEYPVFAEADLDI